MKNEKKIASDKKANQEALKACPHCGSHRVWRIQRSESEKIIYYLSHAEHAAKKYLCKACSQACLLDHNNQPHTDKEIFLLESNDWAIGIPCSKCGAEKLKITPVLPTEKNSFYTATRKTAFRKLLCLHCKAESIIAREDYLAANGNEI